MDINEKLAARRMELAIEAEKEKKAGVVASEELATKDEYPRQFEKDSISLDEARPAIGLKQLIMQDYLRYQNSPRLAAIGRLKSTIQASEMFGHKELSDVDIVNIILKKVTYLRNQINELEAAGQHDLVDAMKLEMNVLNNYLPSELPTEFIKTANDVNLAEVEQSAKKNETLDKPQPAPVIPKKSRDEMNPIWGVVMTLIGLFSGNVVMIFLGVGLSILAVLFNMNEKKSN